MGKEKPIIWTYGYRDKPAPADELVRLVELNRIDAIVDVRRNAASQRPEWASSALQELRGYEHHSALGNRTGAAEGAWEPVDRGEAERELLELQQRIEGGARIVLLCMEPGPRSCHRLEIARRLARRVGAEVRHLR